MWPNGDSRPRNASVDRMLRTGWSSWCSMTRGERVARALERGEPRADGGAEDHPVARSPGDQPGGDDHDDQRLGELLDEPDHDERAGRGGQQVGLHEGRDHDAHRATEHEGQDQHVLGELVLALPGQGEGHHRDGHQEAADQDQGRDQDGVLGDRGDHGPHDPHHGAAHQQQQPAEVVHPGTVRSSRRGRRLVRRHSAHGPRASALGCSAGVVRYG